MAGYSYFSYNQMTLMEVEVHSEELELLKNAADEYDWGRIESEVEPLFKKAVLDFRKRKRSSVFATLSSLLRKPLLNGKQYEPDSLKPLLVDVKENHPNLDIDKVNVADPATRRGDGIFNSQPCRDIIGEILGEHVELFASVNPRNKKDIENHKARNLKISSDWLREEPNNPWAKYWYDYIRLYQ